ncbi:class I SAM-dependent methyltransferase [Phaeospirillum tilakii]|uniref:Class I SAM-dependent methyltransferase n=1 Tax=Phaeospirillum tilakii TaxID=741673 RepID=A0ABW5CCK2_9PROT
MPTDFYRSYASHKRYRCPTIGRKELRRFDREIWRPAGCDSGMAFLELGCGTGAFLAYLAAKGVHRRVGIDQDPALAEVLPAAVRDDFRCGDALALLGDPDLGSFDRIVLLDVLEHFSPTAGCALLRAARDRLAPGGRVVIKVPNAGCPWGLGYQFGDLTHRTAFAPIALRQLADAAGFDAEVRPQRQGSPRRRLTDALLHRFLSWALLTPPEIWTANFYAFLTPRPEEPRR